LIPDKYLDKYESFYWKLYQESATCAVQNYCFTMLEMLSHEAELNLEAPRLIEEHKIDGLIIIGMPGQAYLDFLETNSTVPMLYLDFYDKNHQCDAVITDNYYGMYKMTNYLFEMGHDKIAYVGNLLSTSSITDRFFGYSKALLEHGQTVRPDWIINDRDEAEELTKEQYHIILPDEMPTAFACNCDLSASKLIRALSEKGLQVPDDISVVGFDNYLYPGLCDIGITTYEVDTKEMVRKSIQNIIKKISGADYKRGITIVEGRPVYKESVRDKKF
jgi:DNA-binding LacI/PurR family transcriptional regulator